MNYLHLLSASIVGVSLVLVGCQREPANTETDPKKSDHADHKHADESSEDDIKAARAKLSKEDFALVEAQDYCPIMVDNRLGEMGVPFKVMIQEQPVFLCCKGCRTKALANPEKTLAKVEELKAKVKAGTQEDHKRHQDKDGDKKS